VGRCSPPPPQPVAVAAVAITSITRYFTTPSGRANSRRGKRSGALALARRRWVTGEPSAQWGLGSGSPPLGHWRAQWELTRPGSVVGLFVCPLQTRAAVVSVTTATWGSLVAGATTPRPVQAIVSPLEIAWPRTS
jgi:hypothetical protein